MDEGVYKTRIVTQEWQGAQVSLKKCATSLFQFAASLQHEPDVASKACAKFLFDLQQYSFAMSQLNAVSARCEDEVKHYQGVHRAIDTAITESGAEIELLKDTLQREKQLRARRQEYEEIAGSINKMRSQRELESLIAAVDDDIITATREGDDIDKEIAYRRSQFKDILGAISTMQHSIRDAETSKAAAKAASTANTATLPKDGAPGEVLDDEVVAIAATRERGGREVERLDNNDADSVDSGQQNPRKGGMEEGEEEDEDTGLKTEDGEADL